MKVKDLVKKGRGINNFCIMDADTGGILVEGARGSFDLSAFDKYAVESYYSRKRTLIIEVEGIEGGE